MDFATQGWKGSWRIERVGQGKDAREPQDSWYAQDSWYERITAKFRERGYSAR